MKIYISSDLLRFLKFLFGYHSSYLARVLDAMPVYLQELICAFMLRVVDHCIKKNVAQV